MESICTMTREQLEKHAEQLQKSYESYKARHLKLDMSRGKPGPEQLDLTMDMLECVNAREGYKTAAGVDTRNYGLLDGIPEMKALFGGVLEMEPDNVIIGGNSSLNMMFDYIACAFAKGVCGGKPWGTQGAVKFLCPAPGYDRHFAVTEFFGFELIPVEMTAAGPDMDAVERLVTDPLVKGIWCVPKYSNPTGIVYSDDVVRAFAALKPAARDFRIFWDNAYAIHDFGENIPILNILEECEKTGRPNMPIMFASTSKITFPGSGVALMSASLENLNYMKKQLSIQTIGPDKINQLRHVAFFKNKQGMMEHMKRHADILRPKFETVVAAFEKELSGTGIASWTTPRGGYFISFESLPGCAPAIYKLALDAGLTLTNVGATYPYGKDPKDSNIRIAPSFPDVESLKLAVERFIVCVKLASVEKLLSEK